MTLWCLFHSTSAPSPADDDRLVAAAFQQFFDRLLLDPSLRTDDELRLFLESDFGYTPQTKARRKTGGGGSSFSFGGLAPKSQTHAGRTLSSSNVNGTGGPETVVSVVEEDELSNARLQFRLLEERLLAAGRAVEHVARAGRALAGAHAELSGKWAGLATTETHASLLAGIRRLGETVRAVAAAETAAAVGCLVTLADGLGWCAVEARAGKDVLRNRASVLDEHYTSVKKSIEKRRTIERIKSSASHVGSERVETALDELEEVWWPHGSFAPVKAKHKRIGMPYRPLLTYDTVGRLVLSGEEGGGSTCTESTADLNESSTSFTCSLPSTA